MLTKIYSCKCHGRTYTKCPICDCQYCEQSWHKCPRCVEIARHEQLTAQNRKHIAATLRSEAGHV